MRSLALLAAVVASSSLPLVAGATEPADDVPAPSPDLLMPRARSAKQPTLHPPVVLRDEKGEKVMTSSEAASASRTCDGCHDVAWIEKHDGHVTVSGSAYDLEPATWVSGNCFLCHVGSADNQARSAAIAGQQYDWAETATLAGTGLVARAADGWRWRKEAFRPDGSVAAATLALGRPGSRACGFCHGRVYDEVAPLALARDPSQRMTDLQGSVFSGQRLSDSAVNLAGKAGLYRPWDVHAERLLGCASCHFSPNHPAYAHAKPRPAHLQFDARLISIAEYLRRPDHRLASGPAGEDGHPSGILRCESCHDASAPHRFLPRPERHLGALLCETCHVPRAYAPARQETDWTMLTVARQPRIVYRGEAADGFVTGFRPTLLPRAPSTGDRRLAPNNLVTTYAWFVKADGKPQLVEREVLEKAFFVEGNHRPELVRVLDRDGDGKLADAEVRLDSADKVKLARALLIAAGAAAPEIAAEITPHELHHGVGPGRYATRACADCHRERSLLAEPMLVAGSPPFGVTPSFANQTGGMAVGTLARDYAGRFWFRPALAGLHVFGHTRNRLLDGAGLLAVLATFAAVLVHAYLRIRAARRRSKEPS
jgi:hypothetical protein